MFGKATPIGKNRGRILTLAAGAKVLVTIHPAYLLRMNDADKEPEYKRFVADLKLAVPFVHRQQAA